MNALTETGGVQNKAGQVPVMRRVAVLVIGLLFGAIFSLLVAGPVMPSGMSLANRALVWASVMGGPIVGTAWGMPEYHPSLLLGWLGLLLLPAHPMCPHAVTAWVTLLGFSLWFFAGWLAMMDAVWGA
jgi:hypothetical protein